MKKIICLALCVVMCLGMMAGCTAKADNRVVIYTCATDYRIADMTEQLQQAFPDYELIIEYQSTSKLGAKLLSEGANTDCDIVHDLSYLNMEALARAEILADLSSYDTSIYTDDVVASKYYLPELRTGGAVIINTDVLAQRNLDKPTCYEDLLKPEYKGLISMPDPKSSGTGYMFVKSLVNAWGEEKAFDYFAKLSDNILQFTSSGSGPVNALVQQEVAIGLGMIANAAVQISEGVSLEVLIFEEGSPSTAYGMSMVSGKEERECVKKVFDYIVNTYNYRSCELYAPEQIYKDVTFTVENFPKDIPYSDMSGDTVEEKERLLEKWPN